MVMCPAASGPRSPGVGHGLFILAGWFVVTAILLALTQLRKPAPAHHEAH